MKNPLRISVFGGLTLQSGRRALEAPRSPRVRSLLAWLAMNPGAHPRSAVAARFWPDVLDASARSSLRSALLALRQDLGEHQEHLVASREEVGLRDVEVDWVEFCRHADGADLESAAELAARGPLLPDLDADWVHEARAEFSGRAVEVLLRLAQAEAEAGTIDAAIQHARRAATLEPLSEVPGRELIRLLIASGDRAAATVEYDRLRARLREELGLAPSAPTRELLESALADEAHSRSDSDPSLEQVALPPALGVVERLPFVGRAAALGSLKDALAEARGGSRTLVLLTGEPGIGKTRLASQAARSGWKEGAIALYGRCSEETLAPYEPFVEALRHYVGEGPADLVRAQAGRGLGELARLLPELRGSGTEAPATGDRYALFEAVVSFLEAIGSERPLVLVLDDLHWADSSTLLLLRHIFRPRREAPLMIIGTYRDGELSGHDPLSAALAAIARERPARTLALEGLTETEVRVLVSDLGRGPEEERLAATLHRETAGNPFFVGESVRHLRETGSIGEGDRLAVPDSVKSVIAERVARLGAESTQVLEAAAVAGREFDLAVLEEILDASSDRILEILEEATSARIVAEVPGQVGRHSFAHALVRETLHDGLGRTRRVRMHERIGVALERRRERGEEIPLGEIAYHYSEAVELTDGHKSIAYAIAAAEQSSAQLAHEQAAEQYRWALRGLERRAAADARGRCELLITIGEAEWRAGRYDRGKEAFITAAELAAELDDAALLAESALGYGGPFAGFESGEVDERLLGYLREALLRLPSQQKAVRARLMARLAEELRSGLGVERERDQLGGAAEREARRLDDPATLAHVLNRLHWAQWTPTNVEWRIGVATEVADLAQRIGDRDLLLEATQWRAQHLLELGRADEMSATFATCCELAQELKLPLRLWLPSASRRCSRCSTVTSPLRRTWPSGPSGSGRRPRTRTRSRSSAHICCRSGRSSTGWAS